MKTLLKNAMILTPEKVISQGYVVIEDKEIWSVSEVFPEGRFDCEKDMSDKLLMPGLIDCHCHAPMTLLRGVGTDLPLQQWLFDKVFPVEARLKPEDIRVGTKLAFLELLASGVTSFSDMYFVPEVTAEEVEQCGIKANLTYPVQAFDPKDTYDKNESAKKLDRLFREWHNKAGGRILVDGCIHAEYTCNTDVAAGTAAWCKENGVHAHVHMSETESEQKECIQRHGLTPAGWMEKIGMFDVPCAAAHCVWVTPDDIQILTDHHVSVVHNPSSNMKLGSGFAPIPQMVEKGINVTIGTDGAASNNNLNMLEEMHIASIIHDGFCHDTSLMKAGEIISMATENGAKLQGRFNTGKIEKGYRADLIAIDLDRPHLIPCLDAPGLVTYSAQASDVCMTMVDGKILYEDGNYLTLDREKILYEVKETVNKLY